MKDQRQQWSAYDQMRWRAYCSNVARHGKWVADRMRERQQAEEAAFYRAQEKAS